MLREYQVAIKSRIRYPATLLQPLTNPTPAESPATTLHPQVRYTLQTAPLPVPGNWHRAEWSHWQPSGDNPFIDWQRQAPLVSPWYYRRRPDGVLELLHEREAPGWYHALRTSATWFLQWVAPDPKRTTWTTTEPYTVGEARCEYRLLRKTAQETVYVKRFLGLVNPTLQGKLTLQLSGELRYTLRNRDQVIIAVSGTLQEQSISEGRVVSDSVNQLDVRLVRERPVAETQRKAWGTHWAQLRKTGKLRTIVALPTPEENRLARAQASLGTRTLAQLIEEIRALDKQTQPVENEQLIPLQLALEGALILYPSEAEAFALTHLAQLQTPSPSFWVILGAVSAVERGGALLLRAFKEARSPEIRLILLRQMTFLGRVEPSEFRTLWELYQKERDPDLQTQMELTLAAWVSGLPSELPLEARLFLGRVVRALREAEQAQDESRLRHWIGVLGNTRRAEVVPILEQFARRGTETQRKAALESLSSFPQPEVTELLVRLAGLEPSGAVRGVLVRALRQRWSQSPKVRETLAQLAFNDPEVSVRLAVVEALGSLAAGDAEALQLLVRVSKQNSEERVRRQALIALAALHAQGIAIPKE